MEDAMDEKRMRLALGHILSGSDLDALTVGNLRAKLEERLNLPPGALESRKDYVKRLIQEELVRELQRRNEPDLAADEEELVREPAKKKQKKQEAKAEEEAEASDEESEAEDEKENPNPGPSEAYKCTVDVRKASGERICRLESLRSTTTGNRLCELIAKKDGIVAVRRQLICCTSEIGIKNTLGEYKHLAAGDCNPDVTQITVVYASFVSLVGQLRSDDAATQRHAIWALASASNAEILEFVRCHGVQDAVSLIGKGDLQAQTGTFKVIRRLLKLRRHTPGFLKMLRDAGLRSYMRITLPSAGTPVRDVDWDAIANFLREQHVDSDVEEFFASPFEEFLYEEIGATLQVPPGWTQEHSDEYDLDFYWNEETGESVWEAPPEWYQ